MIRGGVGPEGMDRQAEHVGNDLPDAWVPALVVDGLADVELWHLRRCGDLVKGDPLVLEQRPDVITVVCHDNYVPQNDNYCQRYNN